MARERDSILCFGVDHRVRSDLDFTFLARETRFRFNHDFELGAVFALEACGVSLKLVRHNLAAHVLFPDEIREAFRFLQVDDVVQTLAVVAIRKALRHHGVHLDKRKVQAPLLLEELGHITLDRHDALEQVVHFPAVLFQALEVRLEFRIQKLIAPAARHRDMGKQRVIAIVNAGKARHIAVHGSDVHFLDAPGEFRRHKILEVSTRLVNHVIALDKRRIAF